uniref:Putative secreted protein n=1 Tax=Anopheles darlingi TaxID=43151 RepID=A0A2M4DQ37_ANODA
MHHCCSGSTKVCTVHAVTLAAIGLVSCVCTPNGWPNRGWGSPVAVSFLSERATANVCWTHHRMVPSLAVHT